jgi:hypothetical protein
LLLPMGCNGKDEDDDEEEEERRRVHASDGRWSGGAFPPPGVDAAPSVFSPDTSEEVEDSSVSKRTRFLEAERSCCFTRKVVRERSLRTLEKRSAADAVPFVCISESMPPRDFLALVAGSSDLDNCD